MEQMVTSADFMHTEKDDEQHEFSRAIYEWGRNNSESVTVALVTACLRAAQNKICQPAFPHEGSSGYYMGYHLLKRLQELVSDLIDGGRAQPSDFHEAYLEFILRMIEVGPLSSHIEYICMLKGDRSIDFEQYFMGLTGKKLSLVIRVLKKDYKDQDPGMDRERYLSVHLQKFFNVFISNGFSEQQFTEAHHEFVDLYMFYNLGFKDKDLDLRKSMHRAAYLIELKYDRNIFRGIQDVRLLTEKFSAMGDIILSPEFPQAQDVADETRNDLANILRAVSEGALLGYMYNVILDVALQLTIKKAGCEETRKHFETIGYFFFHVSENGVKHNEELFEGLIQKFIYFLDHVKDETYLTLKFVKPIMDDCLTKAMGTSDEQVHLWIDMIKALLKHSVPDCVETAYRAMQEKHKLLKWKNFPDNIKEIFALMSNITYPKWLTAKQHQDGIGHLKNLASHFLEEAKKAGIVKLGLTKPMLQFVFHCLEVHTNDFYSLAAAVVDKIEYNAKKDKELMMDSIRRVTTMLEDDSYDWDGNVSMDLVSTAGSLVSGALDCVKDGKTFTWEEYEDLIYLSKVSQLKLLSASEPVMSVFFRVYVCVSMKVAVWLQTMNETHRLIPLIPGLLQMLESEEQNVETIGNAQMTIISNSSGSLFARYMDKLITLFLEEEKTDLLMVISNSYQFNPGPLEKRFDELFEHVDSGNTTVRSYMLQILLKVAKHQPQLFTEEKVGTIVNEAKEDPLQQVQLLMILGDIAKYNVEVIEPYIDDFLTPDLWQPMSAYSVTSILQLYALCSEENASRVITYLMSRIKNSKDHNEVLFSLNACRLIGFKHRPAIEKYRSTIEKFKETTSDNDYHASCTAIVDMLDGKSLDKIAEELKEVQGDVADLEGRMAGTENDINHFKGTMQRHGDDLHRVKTAVSEQSQRLDEVEDTVDSTIAKVQEIDGKTLSHAPYWARDVSRLLNIEADNDWRLLSLRLGFSNDDIRAWAQQADPCMAMLNEWYATHKTREATLAVLTSLQLLDCKDAAVIVENAMKNAEAVVSDEEFEYATPPDIFISYQWSHQDEVRLLRQHLEMAGFSCWMDVGQMGGGDKLFEKIDSGVRGAKVVISCVTAKYAKSPNCIREVNLSVSLGKPIIPLLVETTTWPPPGSMGPIFSEYLFIRFFQRGGEETTDQRYWPLPKFQELLMQLSLNGIKPDQKVVQPEYKNWWVPRVEEITVDKDRAKKSTTTKSAADIINNEKVGESPDIFISYQWGKQPQILKLYKAFTCLGYACWLDVMQMGGGDSLYDKIDRGLRGCQVVLSCVTTKYAKSANCRREVSLADALQKPLIPLLLEPLTWPPPGPMSPILTQLLYVDCTKDNVEETWAGPKFDELMAIINRHVPKTQVKAADGKSSREKSQSASAPPQSQEKTRQIEHRKQQQKPEPVRAVLSAPVASVSTDRNNSSSQQEDPRTVPSGDGGGDTKGNESKTKGQQDERLSSAQGTKDTTMPELGHNSYTTASNNHTSGTHEKNAQSSCCVLC